MASASSRSDPPLVVATLNRAKAREIVAALAELPFRVKIFADCPGAMLPAEGDRSYRENALLKAHAAARATGQRALADDSGLEVDALDGRPGVLSARFGGETLDDAARCAHVLTLLEGVEPGRRSARYRCVIAVVEPSGVEHTVEATVDGVIAEEARGAGGFGYDPIFVYPPLGQTFAELPAALKAQVSHRGRALEAAKRLLCG